MTDAKPTGADLTKLLEWNKQLEEDSWAIHDRVCGDCGAEYTLKVHTFNHLVCPECGAMGRGLPPEFEDRVRDRPQPPPHTPIENRWWKGVLAKRGQLKRYFPRWAARFPRSDALKDLMLSALDALGHDASTKAVLDKMQEIDASNVIQEVTDDFTILWRNPKTGREKTTSFASFQNRVSAIRKKRPAEGWPKPKTT